MNVVELLEKFLVRGSNDYLCKAERVEVAHEEAIDAPAAEVFPLFGLERQHKWIDGWNGRFVFSSSGRNEKNCVFEETSTSVWLFDDPNLKTYWITTVYDIVYHRFHAVLANGTLAMGKYEVTVQDIVPEKSLVRFSLTYTAIGEAGNHFFDAGFEEKMSGLLECYGKSIKQYFENGQLIESEECPMLPSVSTSDGFNGIREEASYEEEIAANIDYLFPLICPVEELKWIDMWRYDLIHSVSGRNENNCIFRESMSSLVLLGLPRLWTYFYVSLWDTENHGFRGNLFNADLSFRSLEWDLASIGADRTLVKIDYTYTSLSEKGNRVLDDCFRDRIVFMLSFMTRSLKYYGETGKMLELKFSDKMRILFPIFGTVLRKFVGLPMKKDALIHRPFSLEQGEKAIGRMP